MAEWDPSVAYSPGDTVTYRGQVYVRSQYPVAPTAGSPPNVEMGTDPKGDAIRTWMISIPESGSNFAFHPFYYRVIHPPMSSAQQEPVQQYGDESDYAENAYAPIYVPLSENITSGTKRGYTVEFGQPSANPIDPRILCPGEYCGIGFQQGQEVPVYGDPPEPAGPMDGLYINIDAAHDLIPKPGFPGEYIQNPLATKPYNWYVFFRFNHALLFRRACTITAQFRKDYVPLDPPGPTVVSYVYVNETATPSDKNYASWQFSNFNPPPGPGSYWIDPDNAFVIIVEPEPEETPAYTVSYTLTQVYLNITDPNW